MIVKKNPISTRKINFNGPKHKKLIKNGILDENVNIIKEKVVSPKKLRKKTQIKKIGKLTDTFKIIKRLGVGEFSEAFLVKKYNGDLRVLKVFKTKDHMAINEYNILKKISCHRLIVCIFDIFEGIYNNKEHIILEMEYISGYGLDQFIEHKNKQRKKDYFMIRIILKELLEGLQYLHSKFIVHGDLKPDNIIFNNNTLKIIDFGASRYYKNIPTGMEKTGHTGYAPYLAPEWEDLELDLSKINNNKIDMWSLGIILLELLTNGEVDIPYFNRPGEKNIGDRNINENLSKRDIADLPKDIKTILYSLLNDDYNRRLTAPEGLSILLNGVKMLTYNQFQSKVKGNGLSSNQIGQLWTKYKEKMINDLDLTEKNIKKLAIKFTKKCKRVSLLRNLYKAKNS